MRRYKELQQRTAAMNHRNPFFGGNPFRLMLVEWAIEHAMMQIQSPQLVGALSAL
jgi:hypothetical protein